MNEPPPNSLDFWSDFLGSVQNDYSFSFINFCISSINSLPYLRFFISPTPEIFKNSLSVTGRLRHISRSVEFLKYNIRRNTCHNGTSVTKFFKSFKQSVFFGSQNCILLMSIRNFLNQFHRKLFTV